MDTSLYRVQGPSAWAEPLCSYSYSSLTSVERCPRQWQLLRSRYDRLDRFPARPNPAAVEGDIVHELLNRLFRTLAVRGMPPQGAAAFKEGVGAVEFSSAPGGNLGEPFDDRKINAIRRPQPAPCRPVPARS